jgi:hypothetical protein
MRYRNAACALGAWMIAVLPAVAQTVSDAAAQAPDLVPPPAWAFNDLACAPSLLMEKGAKEEAQELRVVGVQDGAFRELLGPPDVLVVSGGSNTGLEAGQRFFVRRLVKPIPGSPQPPTVHTAGWVQILGVDATVSTAQILHACEGILLDDFLEPYVAPMIAAKPIAGTTPYYENMGHIVAGIDGLHTSGVGSVMNIDRGSNAGVVVGQRFLVFRDKRKLHPDTSLASRVLATHIDHAPLVQIGEVLVVSVRPQDATVQVTVAKDAVSLGDLIAPIK